MTPDPWTPRRVQLDVGEQVGEPAHLVGTVFPATAPGTARAVLVCLPGGTYTRGYYDLEVPGLAGYSFARDAAARGYTIVTFDVLGTGESSRPAREVGLADQAAAAAAAAARLPAAIGHPGPFLGIGHSMGGYVLMLQQAAFRSYTAVAILGTTNGPVAPLQLPADFVAAAATPEGRAALVEQTVAAMPEPYLAGSREPMLSWFHLGDVPPPVVDADTASTLTVVPRRCGAEATVPGITAAAAAAIDVPVFLGYGDVDVSGEPRAESSFFTASRDITTFVLAGSGHCHNMASTRGVLWDRLARWSDTVI